MKRTLQNKARNFYFLQNRLLDEVVVTTPTIGSNVEVIIIVLRLQL
jgi:hypothetical protein